MTLPETLPSWALDDPDIPAAKRKQAKEEKKLKEEQKKRLASSNDVDETSSDDEENQVGNSNRKKNGKSTMSSNDTKPIPVYDLEGDTTLGSQTASANRNVDDVGEYEDDDVEEEGRIDPGGFVRHGIDTDNDSTDEEEVVCEECEAEACEMKELLQKRPSLEQQGSSKRDVDQKEKSNTNEGGNDGLRSDSKKNNSRRTMATEKDDGEEEEKLDESQHAEKDVMQTKKKINDKTSNEKSKKKKQKIKKKKDDIGQLDNKEGNASSPVVTAAAIPATSDESKGTPTENVEDATTRIKRKTNNNTANDDLPTENCCFVRYFCCNCNRTCWFIYLTMLGLLLASLIVTYVVLRVTKNNPATTDAPSTNSIDASSSKKNDTNIPNTINQDPLPPKEQLPEQYQVARESDIRSELKRLIEMDNNNLGQDCDFLLTESSGSPQYKAYEWIVHRDGQQLSVDNSVASSPSDDGGRLAQRYSLAVLYYSVMERESKTSNNTLPDIAGGTTKGARFVPPPSDATSLLLLEGSAWLSNTHECLWEGVTCSPRYIPLVQTTSDSEKRPIVEKDEGASFVEADTSNPHNILTADDSLSETTEGRGRKHLSEQNRNLMETTFYNTRQIHKQMNEVKPSEHNSRKYLRAQRQRREMKEELQEDSPMASQLDIDYFSHDAFVENEAPRPFRNGERYHDRSNSSRVVELDLSSYSLMGAVPLELKLLSKLTSLDLSKNQLSSVDAWNGFPILEHIFPKLVTLRLNDNPSLVGTIELFQHAPENLSELRVVNLQNTQLDLLVSQDTASTNQPNNTSIANVSLYCRLVGESILMLDEDDKWYFIESEGNNNINETTATITSGNITRYCENILQDDENDGDYYQYYLEEPQNAIVMNITDHNGTIMDGGLVNATSTAQPNSWSLIESHQLWGRLDGDNFGATVDLTSHIGTKQKRFLSVLASGGRRVDVYNYTSSANLWYPLKNGNVDIDVSGSETTNADERITKMDMSGSGNRLAVLKSSKASSNASGMSFGEVAAVIDIYHWIEDGTTEGGWEVMGDPISLTIDIDMDTKPNFLLSSSTSITFNDDGHRLAVLMVFEGTGDESSSVAAVHIYDWKPQRNNMSEGEETVDGGKWKRVQVSETASSANHTASTPATKAIAGSELDAALPSDLTRPLLPTTSSEPMFLVHSDSSNVYFVMSSGGDFLALTTYGDGKDNIKGSKKFVSPVVSVYSLVEDAEEDSDNDTIAVVGRGRIILNAAGDSGMTEENDIVVSSLSMSKDGSRVAVGTSGGKGNRGKVQVYTMKAKAAEDTGEENKQTAAVDKSTSFDWTPLGSSQVGEVNGDRAGYSLDLSDDGTWLVVGYPGSKNKSGSGGGYARLFHLSDVDSDPNDTKDWIQVGHLDLSLLSTSLEGDMAGYSVALSISPSSKELSLGTEQHKDEDGESDATLQRMNHDGITPPSQQKIVTVAMGAPGFGNNGRGYVQVFSFAQTASHEASRP